jgi:hypothetical protein
LKMQGSAGSVFDCSTRQDICSGSSIVNDGLQGNSVSRSSLIVGFIALAIAVWTLILWVGRKRQGKPLQWVGGIPMSRLSIASFIAFEVEVAVAALTGLGLLILILIPSFCLIVISNLADHRRARKEISLSRSVNLSKDDQAFQAPPPKLSAQELPQRDAFKIYDVETAKYLGTLSHSQLKYLIERYSKWGQEPNDFFVLAEEPEMLGADNADPELVAFLRRALGGRGSMEIRWILT